MSNTKFYKFIERLIFILAGIAILSYMVFLYFNYKFLGLFALFLIGSLNFLLLSVTPYDVMWRKQDVSFRTRKIWNVCTRLVSAFFFVFSMYYAVIPYAEDINQYLSKDYNNEKGIIQSIVIYRNSKSITSSVDIKVNGKEIIFERMSSNSVDFFRNLKKGDLVQIWYLPHSKYGMKIDVYNN